jgi:hypothetical protein
MEIICPHCQARHAAEAEVCPVCGTPVDRSASVSLAGAAIPPATALGGATPPAEHAAAPMPMPPSGVAARYQAPAHIAPWRLVLLGIAGTLLVVALFIVTITKLFAHPLVGDPPLVPTATGAPAIWSPSAVTPSALPDASPAPTATRTPRPATATPGSATGGTSPTATALPPTAMPTLTPTTTPPTATATMIPPTETPTPQGGG